MSYSAPRTFVAGEVVTAAMLNQEIRDNMIYKPTGRTASYVIAASNSSALDKSQADFVCNGTSDITDIQTIINNLPAIGSHQDGQGNTITTGVKGSIFFFDGFYTGGTGQIIIPAGSSVSLTGETPSSYNGGLYGTTVPYVNGVFIYFTGTTYPVFSAPKNSFTAPSTALDITNIVFMVKNPVALQSDQTFAFNCDGWSTGTWSNVMWISDAASLTSSTWQNGNIEGLSIDNDYRHDRMQIDSMTCFGFAGIS